MITLEELLEKCGDNIVLMKDTGGDKDWIASTGIQNTDHGWCFNTGVVLGKTPEEAIRKFLIQCRLPTKKK